MRIAGLGAYVCPYCFGFERLQDRIFIERSTTATDRTHALASLADSRSRVEACFDGLESTPRIFVCVTEICYRRTDRGAGLTRGFSYLDLLMVLSPRGKDGVIAVHELTHVEFHHRVGIRSVATPAWFDEGLAVYVSDDRRYLAPKGTGERCPLRTHRGHYLIPNEVGCRPQVTTPRSTQWLRVESPTG
jgi:hypothetical protein